MGDFKFGEMVCYKSSALLGKPIHDGPVMFLSECHHRRNDGLIDLMGIPEGKVEHKEASMWQRCTHLDKPKETIRVYVDGKDVTDDIEFRDFRLDVPAGTVAVHGKSLGTSAIQFDIQLGDDV